MAYYLISSRRSWTGNAVFSAAFDFGKSVEADRNAGNCAFRPADEWMRGWGDWRRMLHSARVWKAYTFRHKWREIGLHFQVLPCSDVLRRNFRGCLASRLALYIFSAWFLTVSIRGFCDCSWMGIRWKTGVALTCRWPFPSSSWWWINATPPNKESEQRSTKIFILRGANR